MEDEGMKKCPKGPPLAPLHYTKVKICLGFEKCEFVFPKKPHLVADPLISETGMLPHALGKNAAIAPPTPGATRPHCKEDQWETRSVTDLEFIAVLEEAHTTYLQQ